MFLLWTKIVKPNIKWFSPLLLLFFIYPTVTEAGLYPIIDHSIYGVRLGEQQSLLSHNIRKSGKTITHGLKNRDKLYNHGKVLTYNGALQNRSGIDHTRIFILSGQVYKIEVVFKSHSKRKYKQVREKLIDEYGDFETDANGSAIFFTQIDGQNVSVRLNRVINNDSGKLDISLQYFYKRFARDVVRLHRKKMLRNSLAESFTAR